MAAGESSSFLECEKCQRDCEPIELETCPMCNKRYCPQCQYRIGGRQYCGRACGDAFFFGGADSEDDLYGEE